MSNDARPTGRLVTGAVGNFLIGGAMLAIALTGMAAGVASGGNAMAGVGLIIFLMFVAGGICASLGWFGLGRMYGGMNTLAGIFAILIAILPVALIVAAFGFAEAAVRGNLDDMSQSSAMRMVTIVLGIFFGIPSLGAIFGGLAQFSAKAGIAKVGGIVLLVSGLATATLAVLVLTGPTSLFEGAAEAGMAPSTLMTILTYVGYYGSAAGFILAGVTMLAERSEPA